MSLLSFPASLGEFCILLKYKHFLMPIQLGLWGSRLVSFSFHKWKCLLNGICYFVTFQSSVFPPEKQVSPVADQLRQMLANAPWARVGLGLPVVSYIVFITTAMHVGLTKSALNFHWLQIVISLLNFQVPASSVSSSAVSETNVSRHEAEVGKCKW